MSIQIPEYLNSAQPLATTAAARAGCDGSAVCETKLACGGQCENCQTNAQYPCLTVCEDTCQQGCQVNCQSTCESTCQTTGQSGCHVSCEVTCMTGCQVTCEDACENYCQNCQGSSCQYCQACMSCQSSCEDCQTTCETSCQNCQGASCQTCQTACERATQTVVKYQWRFNEVTASSNTVDKVVRGIWSGFVGGREVLCAACNGRLWELEQNEDGSWEKTNAGTLDTTEDVCMFGFSEKLYLLNGSEYKVWDGETLENVVGYVPLIMVSVDPATGSGTTLEGINKLTASRRVQFNTDGTTTVFQLPETGIASVTSAKNVATGAALTISSSDTANGKVTLSEAPAEGANSIEITYAASADYASEVRAMRYAELYNGAQDTRVFIYGDGSNKALYSDIDTNGEPRADYFPDLNVAHVGDANTPITAMIRHYNRLLAFKLDSTWSIYYGSITLADGILTAGFYISPVNRSVGNCAPGQAVLVENRPRTLDGRSVMEWKPTSSSGNINGDERNAQRISQKVDATIRTFDLETAKTYYDKYNHEYYVIGDNGNALVQNTTADAWYTYTNFAACCLINYKDELYFGTRDGELRHFSDTYFADNGEAIDAYWESGAMDFTEDFRRKYSAMLWVGIKPEDNGYLSVSAETDHKTDFAEYDFDSVASGEVPEMTRLKLKAKKFTYYKLILSNNTADKTATVVSVDIRVRGTGYVR